MQNPEISGGIKDLISFVLRMRLYKHFKKDKIHFTTLEENENRIKENLQNQFIKKMKEKGE